MNFATPQQRAHRGVGELDAADDQVPQFVIGQRKKLVQHGDLVFGKRCALRVQKAGEYQIVLEHPAPASPADPRKATRIDHRNRVRPPV